MEFHPKRLVFDNIIEVKQYVKTESIKQINLKFPDLYGNLKNLSLPATNATIDFLENKGVGFDASSFGIKPIEQADMVLKPLWDNGFTELYRSDIIAFFVDIVDPITKESSGINPRNIAISAMDYAKQEGFCSNALFAPEYEFYLIKNNAENYQKNIFTSNSVFNSYELPMQNAYHSNISEDEGYVFREQLFEICESLGIPIKYHHHEVGINQHEIEVNLTQMLDAADHFVLLKYVAKMLTQFHENTTITFMPKPFAGYPGSGLHCHQTLIKNGKNLFYDKDGYVGLSKEALSYIAGILFNGNALLGITNPSVNSYRRLVPGFEAPTMAFFSPANRSAAIRIPAYARNTTDQRIEFRTPDAMSNPYLLLSSQLMAGIYGIKHKLDPKHLGFGPVEENIFDWDENKLNTLKSLPSSLKESLDALERNHDFLTQGNVYSKAFIGEWIKNKRKDIKLLQGIPSLKEIQVYLNK